MHKICVLATNFAHLFLVLPWVVCVYFLENQYVWLLHDFCFFGMAYGLYCLVALRMTRMIQKGAYPALMCQKKSYLCI